MNEDRIWEFETELWTGSAEAYDRKVADDCVMALPTDPWLLDGAAARKAVKETPRWDTVEFSDTHVAKPEHGLIVIAYRAKASRGGKLTMRCVPARCGGLAKKIGKSSSTSKPRSM